MVVKPKCSIPTAEFIAKFSNTPHIEKERVDTFHGSEVDVLSVNQGILFATFIDRNLLMVSEVNQNSYFIRCAKQGSSAKRWERLHLQVINILKLTAEIP